MPVHSADDIIIATENKTLEQLGGTVAPKTPTKAEILPESREIPHAEADKPLAEAPKEPEKAKEATPTPEVKAEVTKETKSDSTESGTDEYGNEIPKPRTYSEAEVQEMIRD